MILFHGTVEESVKKIRKEGLKPGNREDNFWKYVVDEPVCFLSNQPITGSSGNPRDFAYRYGLGGDGYLTVFNIPPSLMKDKIVGIFDNRDVEKWWKYCCRLDFYDCRNVKHDERGREHWQSRKIRFERISQAQKEMKFVSSWLNLRKLSTPSNNCQILTRCLEPELMVCILKVLDNGSGKPTLVEKFNPKMQRKLKHKQKTFASLVWHEVFKHLRK